MSTFLFHPRSIKVKLSIPLRMMNQSSIGIQIAIHLSVLPCSATARTWWAVKQHCARETDRLWKSEARKWYAHFPVSQQQRRRVHTDTNCKWIGMCCCSSRTIHRTSSTACCGRDRENHDGNIVPPALASLARWHRFDNGSSHIRLVRALLPVLRIQAWDAWGTGTDAA